MGEIGTARMAGLSVLSAITILLIFLSLPSYSQSQSLPISFEYLDSGKIIHKWNDRDHYYINVSSGIQATNNFEDFWTRNLFCLGYLAAGEWTEIACSDSLPGFTSSAVTDNQTYANFTLKRTVNYAAYQLNVTVRYSLLLGADRIKIEASAHNPGIPFPLNLSFGWKSVDIRIASTYKDDFLLIRNNSGVQLFNLSSQIDKKFTDSEIQPFYMIEDLPGGEGNGSLLLEWESRPSLLIVKSQAGQYNAPVILAVNIGPISSGETKSASFNWHDAFCSVSCTGGNSVTGVSIACPNCIGTEPENSTLMRCRVDTAIGDGSCTLGSGCKLTWQYNKTHGAVKGWTNMPQNDSTPATFLGLMCNELGSGDCQNSSPNDDVWYNKYVVCNEHYTSNVRCKLLDSGQTSESLGFQCTDRLIPSFSQVTDNSSGLVYEGQSVLTSVRWFDLGTGDTAILRTNKTGVWQDESQISIRLSSPACAEAEECIDNFKWAYLTISTIGLGNRQICWIQWANDTNNNWNTEMPLTCFSVLAANESEGRAAIDQGINNSLPNNPVQTGQQIYMVNQAGQHFSGTFDKAVRNSNQTWAFNYVTGSESFTSIPSLFRTLNIWENQSISFQSIANQVQAFINQTKV